LYSTTPSGKQNSVRRNQKYLLNQHALIHHSQELARQDWPSSK